MSSGRQYGKLEQLRAKTDQQLLILIGAELERALESEARGDSSRAARAYVEATRVLPLLQNISWEERARLGARLDAVRDRISEEATTVC